MGISSSKLLDSLGITPEEATEALLETELDGAKVFSQERSSDSVKSNDFPEISRKDELIEQAKEYFDRDDVIQLAKNDLNFLAGLAMPDVIEYEFPAMYLAMWQWITNFALETRRVFPKLALGIPRGFAKTTFVKLLVLFIILFTTKRFIAIISAKEQHGKNIIADVLGFLQQSNIISVFGDYSFGSKVDKQEYQRFSYRGRDIILVAVGRDGTIRGMNIDNRRPDVMIMEDYQPKEDSENPELSQRHLEKLTGTIMKARAHYGCMYLYVGNMYNTSGCILKKLKASPDWVKFIVGGILADGTSLWEDLQPLEQLLAEYNHDKSLGQEAVFLSEILNDEDAGLRSGVDLNAIQMSDYGPGDLPDAHFIILDPSGSNSTSDMNALGYFRVFETTIEFRSCSQGHWSPLQLIVNAIIMGLQNQCSTICVEAVAYQQSLLFWFNYICEKHHLEGFQFIPITPKSRAKPPRIKEMLKMLTDQKQHRYVLHQDVSPQFKAQVRDWNPLKPNQVDDLLDIAAYAPQVLQDHGPMCLPDIVPSVLIQEVDDIPNIRPAYLSSPF